MGIMNTQKEKKLMKMLASHVPGTVELAPWLENLGISRELQRSYKNHGWLEKVGPGAYKRPSEELTWFGGVFSIQRQAGTPIHAGALTALTLLGRTHYLRNVDRGIYLFSPCGTLLPQWFRKHDWGQPVQMIRSNFLPDKIGLDRNERPGFSIVISAPERAILECLYLAPDRLDLVECFHLVEGLPDLRPSLLQSLLESCSSVRVKRLFLFMAWKARHPWYPFLNLRAIDLGSGDRSIVKGGVYVSEFRISIPEELAVAE